MIPAANTAAAASSAFAESADHLPQPEAAASSTGAELRTLSLSIKEHDICFVVPAGARIDAHRLDLPGGILVLGALRGSVFCSSGSAIIAKGAEFQGELNAANIYVEGRITSPKNPRQISRLRARGTTTAEGQSTGGLAAFGASAVVHAHVQAKAFHVPRQATFTHSMFEVID